ncbi:hypothetical protein B0T17DRAFT_569430 [Bombardia bombarda]|uniref:AMP-dependent synthetase/ligase domain-containing protein n=1 Tax=Bombardia bombarda TaxID=252184 RepID=A0AA39XKB7_9PEZI|nr:hypothetical protein B0T17DRAFT_569430 [Bombardia bombarda]
MGFLDNVLVSLDEGVTGLFGQWNTYTTALFTLFIGLITYQVSVRRDPDTHPLLLARQAQASPVRQPGESAVYRSQAAPHGMPLNAGLNIKDAGASKWSRGRDGDLRDIWRQAIAGVQDEGPTKGVTGRVMTVMGTELVTDHALDSITRQINLIGQHILDQGGNRVAIYLPNSVELIATLFACAFYNMTAIILPFDQPDDAVISMLRRSAADTVVTVPGSFPFDVVVKNYPSLRQLVWVVDDGNSHMDWNEVPKGTGGSVNVATWQDVISDSPVDAGKELPPLEGQKEPRDVTVFWQSKPGTAEEMVRFTAANLVSAVSAQIFSIPTSQRIGPSDLFLPADSLANTHTLVLTLGALYSNASVAFNSVAVRANDLAVATRGIAPTILVATPEALLKTHQESSSALSSIIARNLHWLQTRDLTQNGVMPAASLLNSYYDRLRPAIGAKPGKLRLIFTAERAGAGTPALSSAVISDLRIYTRSRIIYALTAAKVAGAAAQTGYYDYRVFDDKQSHFGQPVTSAEIMLKDTPDYKTTDDLAQGEIFIKGLCVAGGEAGLGVVGTIRDDNTLAYV